MSRSKDNNKLNLIIWMGIGAAMLSSIFSVIIISKINSLLK